MNEKKKKMGLNRQHRDKNWMIKYNPGSGEGSSGNTLLPCKTRTGVGSVD